jgi:hypothetical protein
VEGTVEIQTSEPLMFSELTVTLMGRATTRIYREISVALLLFGRWKAKVPLCERVLVLLDQDITLQPGEHRFPFRLRIPETTDTLPTESEGEGEKKKTKKAWQPFGPFLGSEAPHALPPSMQVKAKQDNFLYVGDSSGQIEYELQVTRRTNPKSWKTPPAFIQKLKIAAPLAAQAEEIKWMDTSKPLGGAHRDVTVSVKYPSVIVQWEKLPVQIALSEGEGVSLVSFKVKLYTLYAVRGRSWYLPEKSSLAHCEEKLIVWQGKIDLSPGQYQVVQSQPLSAGQAVANFGSPTVVCIAHELEIKYKVQDSKGKVISGMMNRVPVDIRGPNRAVDPKAEAPRASMNKVEYQMWDSGRKG